MKEVERWAHFVKTHPRSEWKPIVDKLVNADFERLKKIRIESRAYRENHFRK